MNRKEFFHLSTLTNWVVATKRSACPSQRMAALLRLAMEQPCLAPEKGHRGCKAAKAATGPLLSRLPYTAMNMHYTSSNY